MAQTDLLHIPLSEILSATIYYFKRVFYFEGADQADFMFWHLLMFHVFVIHKLIWYDVWLSLTANANVKCNYLFERGQNSQVMGAKKDSFEISFDVVAGWHEVTRVAVISKESRAAVWSCSENRKAPESCDWSVVWSQSLKQAPDLCCSSTLRQSCCVSNLTSVLMNYEQNSLWAVLLLASFL